MNDMQKAGGIAAIVEAATFVVGFALLFTVLLPAGYGVEGAPAESVAFLARNQAMLYVWNLIIFIIFGVVLVVLAMALYQRLRAGSPTLAPLTAAFGVIWATLVIGAGMVTNIGLSTVVELHAVDPAQAVPVWLALEAVQDGLGGGNEIVGAVWILLVSWAALRAKALPMALNYLGALIGVAGLLTVIPGLSDVGAVFGLGLIGWFTWVGITMLRGGPSPEIVSTPLTVRGQAGTE